MKTYVILNWKTGELMDWLFNAVSIEEAEIYDDSDYAQNEIDSKGEPFCKVIEVSEVEAELQKVNEYNNLGGVDLYSLEYGQRFKILQKGWEGMTFIFAPKKSQPSGDRIKLYGENGNDVSISGEMAATLKVEVI